MYNKSRLAVFTIIDLGVMISAKINYRYQQKGVLGRHADFSVTKSTVSPT